MDRDKLQRKSFLQNPPFMGLLLLCATLIGSLLAFQLNSSTAHAASLSNDPLVTVSIDKTQGSSCTEIFQANIGTPQAASKQISCAPGTIMADVTMLRSQAIAQHEAYAVIPSPQDSAAIHQQYMKQIQALHTSKQATLRSQMSTYARPATGCGNSGSVSATWSPIGSGKLYASIAFYKSSDCSSAYFTVSQLNSTGLGPDAVWGYDMYAGYQYSVPSCPNVGIAGHYFHLVSQSAPVGYYYENSINYIYPDACWGDVGNVWDNLGPIN